MNEIQEFLNGPYGLATAAGVGGLVIGYVIKAIRGSSYDGKQHEEEMARLALRKERISLRTVEETNRLELTRMEAGKEEISYRRRIEQDRLAREENLAARLRGEAVEVRNHAMRLQIVEKVIPELRPAMEAYASAVRAYAESAAKSDPNGEITRKRQDYREKLVEEALEEKERSGATTALDEDFNLSAEEQKRIEDIVNVRHPLVDVPIPNFPETIIDRILGNGHY